MADTPKPGGQGSPNPPATGDKPADAPKPGEGAKADEKPAGDKPADAPAGDKPAGDAPTGDAPKGDEGKGGDKPAASGAPDKYDLKIPDGAEAWFGDDDIATIATIAKQQNWTNEQAQTALEEHADRLVAQSEQFRTMTENDPELGGEKLEETQRLATAALDRIRPTSHARSGAFRKLLTKSGFGNHPEVLAFLADIGKLTREDKPASGNNGGGGVKKSTAEKFYGKP